MTNAQTFTNAANAITDQDARFGFIDRFENVDCEDDGFDMLATFEDGSVARWVNNERSWSVEL